MTDTAPAPLKPYTSYVCPDGIGLGHSSHWTGAYLRPGSNDGWCSCGKQLVEEVDDGTRWRVSFEYINPEHPDAGWIPISREDSSEASIRSQVEGLHELVAKGELIRNVRMERSTGGWEEVT